MKSREGMVEFFRVILHEECDTAMQVAETSRTCVQRDIILCHIKEQVKIHLKHRSYSTDRVFQQAFFLDAGQVAWLV
jgi:hypothetical protein